MSDAAKQPRDPADGQPSTGPGTPPATDAAPDAEGPCEPATVPVGVGEAPVSEADGAKSIESGEPPVAAASGTEDAEPTRERLDRIERAMSELSRLTRIEDTVAETFKRVSFLPPKLRDLGGKIDAAATSISEPRYKAALEGLVGILDLVDNMLRSTPAETGSPDDQQHRRNYEVLRTQIKQTLITNGLTEIPTDGEFDPSMHTAIGRRETLDPEKDQQIAEVLHAGFRTEHAVLRYAEVEVWHCAEAFSDSDQAQPTDEAAPDPSDAGVGGTAETPAEDETLDRPPPGVPSPGLDT